MSDGIKARGTVRTPSHGVGQLVTWNPGQSGNPSGRPAGMKEVRALCRKISQAGVEALARIVTETVIDEHGNTRNAHDGKVIVPAVQTLLQWGFGKPPDYDPKEDEAGVRINTAVLTPGQRKALLEALRAGLLVPDDAPPSDASSPEIEGVIVADRQPDKDDG